MDPTALLELGSLLKETYDFWRENWKQIKTSPTNKPANLDKNEILVIVAHFNSSANLSVDDPGKRLFIGLNRELEGHNGKFPIRVEMLESHEVLNKGQALGIRDGRNATLIVWGDMRENDIRYMYSCKLRIPSGKFEIEMPVMVAPPGTAEIETKGEGGYNFILDTLMAFLLNYRGAESMKYLNEAVEYAVRFLPHWVASKALVQRAQCNFNEGDYDTAGDDSDLAIQLDPQNADAYVMRGSAHSRFNDERRACLDFDKAIEIESHHAIAYANRAVSNMRLGNPDAAMADINKSIQFQSDRVEPYLTKAAFCQINGDFNEGLRVLSLAQRKSNSRIWMAYIFVGKATLYCNAAQFKKAISCCNRAIKISPNFARAYSTRGVAYGEIRRFDMAIKDFGESLKLDPDNLDALVDRGLVYIDKGEEKKGWADIMEAKGRDPKRMIQFWRKGKSYII